MSFPLPRGISTIGNMTTNTSPTVITLPSGIVVGDRVQVWLTVDQTGTGTWPAGWTQLFSVPNGLVVTHESYYRDWTGTETIPQGSGGSISVSHAANMSAWVAYIVAQVGTFDPATAPQWQTATGNTTTPNPAPLDPPTWGTEDTRWYASCGWDNGTTALSTNPASYFSVHTDRSDNNQGVGTAVAVRNNAVGSEDPGPFTLVGATAREWVASVTAHRPAVLATGALTGTAGLTLSTSATLTGSGRPITQLQLAGIAGQRYGSFARLVGGVLTGTSNLTLTATATLSVTGALAGTASLSLTTAATFSAAIRLTASPALALSAAATLTVTVGGAAALTGTSTLRITTSANLSAAIRFTGTATLRLTASGLLPYAFLPLSARERELAVEFLVQIGAGSVHVGTRAHVGASWIETPELWLLTPDLWLDLRPIFRPDILGDVEFHSELQKEFFGFTDVGRGRVRIDNREGRYNDLWATGQGQPFIAWRHDRRMAPPVTLVEYRGVVDRVTLGDGDDPHVIDVEFTAQDLSVLDTLLPKRLTSTELFGPACPEPGVPIKKIIGTVEHVRMPYVIDDTVYSVFWYGPFEGQVTISAVYRDRSGETQLELLNPSEYQVHYSAEGDWTAVRTYVRQSNFSGGFHNLYADVSGPANERNPAIAFARLMNDPTWGCGQPIDGTAIMAEAALLPAELVLDGVLGSDDQQHPLRDYLEQILMVRSGRPVFEPQRGWSVEFDSIAPAVAAMTLQDGRGPGERTMLAPGRRSRPALNDRIRSLQFRYGYDEAAEEYTYLTSERVVGPVGKATTLPDVLPRGGHDFLRDRAAADHVAHYYAMRLAGAADLVEGAVVHEGGRRLQVGDIVHVICPQLQLAGDDRLVVGVTKAAGAQTVNHVAWNPAQYTHVAGALPALQALNPAVTTPVSFFGNADLTAASLTNPIRMGIFENDTPPLVTLGTDQDLVVGTYTTIGPASLILVIGRAYFLNYDGTGPGTSTQVNLKVRIDGALPSFGALGAFSMGDIAASNGDSQTLQAFAVLLVGPGPHEIKLQANTTKGPWEASFPTVLVVEFVR
jgi:hypothetical protein